MVHGLHAVLWAIDCWANGAAGYVALKSLKIAFRKPIPLGTDATFSLLSEKDSLVRMGVMVDGDLAAKSSLSGSRGVSVPRRTLSFTDCGTCRPRTAEDISAASGKMPLGLHFALGG